MFDTIFYGTGFGRDRMSPARAAYLFLMWVLIPGWLVMRFYNLLVGLALTGGFSMLSQRLDADISFRNPVFTWTGDIGFEDLRVRPRDPAESDPMSLDIRRVVVDMPNLGVMQSVLTAAGNGEDSKEHAGMLSVINRMDHIGLRVEGMKYDLVGGLPGVLSEVGVASAAPLEAEGCVGDDLWVASELPKLGISNDGIDLQLTLANAPEAHEVHVTGTLVSPHSSRAEFAQHFKAANMSAFLNAPQGSRIATYERVAIQDDGFVAARDAYCAKRDGVDPEAFRERHIAAARRLLEAGGMRPTTELESVYRQYLEHGKLVLEASPNGNVRREDYQHYSIADQGRMYNGTLAAEGKPVPVRFDAVPARGIPENFAGSTWDLIALETRAAEARGEMLAGEVEAQPAPAPAVVAAPTAVASAPVAPVAAPAAAAAPVAAPAPAAAAPAPAPAATNAAVGLPSWAIAPTTTRTTADGRPLASSLPPKGNAHAQVQSLDFAQLAEHLGERLEITTVYGDHRQGRLEGVHGQALSLRISAGAGYAIQSIERAQIRLIRDLD